MRDTSLVRVEYMSRQIWVSPICYVRELILNGGRLCGLVSVSVNPNCSWKYGGGGGDNFDVCEVGVKKTIR